MPGGSVAQLAVYKTKKVTANIPSEYKFSRMNANRKNKPRILFQATSQREKKQINFLFVKIGAIRGFI